MKNCLLVLIIALTIMSCNKESNPAQDNQNKTELRTLPPSNVGNDFASLNIQVLDDGGEQITATGLCWSTDPEPSLKDSSIVAGTATGTYNVNISYLVVETRYYAKAFATNKYGTVYGNRISFITKYLLPTMFLDSASGITQTTADLKCRVVFDGGAKVTERGFIWDTKEVTLADTRNKISLGSDTGTFSTTIKALTPATRYYVKGYAINKAGVFYSAIEFITR